MTKQLIARCFLILWVFIELGINVVGTTGINNAEKANRLLSNIKLDSEINLSKISPNLQGAVRNGWQPLLNYDNVGGSSLPENYQYTQSYYDPDRERSYNSEKQQRKPSHQESSNQHDYTPPSILGSFSIFGYSVPKSRDEELKNHRETANNNKNEYDFLMPPPRQKLEPYQKLKVTGDSYGGPSHYRDIYTPLNNHFTFVPTNGAASALKKSPQTLYREETQIYPLRQFPTSIDSQHKPHQSHQKSAPWILPHRVNVEPYHTNYRQHPLIHNEPSIDTGNRYYTQISPPLFKQNQEFQKSPKPIKNQSEYVTLNPANLYIVQASTSPRNELLPITASDLQFIPQHIEQYLFEQNSLGKQPPKSVGNHHYNIKQRENATFNWPVSSTKYSELLPNYNKPTEFKQAHEHTRILPKKILPVAPTKQDETPESISLKHFNEQQYLLQQQLLERDRKKLEELAQQNVSSKFTNEPVESTTVKKIIDQFEIYESVKLTKGDKTPPERRPIVNDYSGKKKRVNNNGIVVASESSDYEHQIVLNGQQYSFENNHNSWKPSNSPDFITDMTPTVTTSSEPLRKLPQKLTSYEQSSTTPFVVIRKSPQKSMTQYEKTSPIPSDFTRKSPQQSTPQYQITSTIAPTETMRTTTNTRSHSRKPTRRRRPILEAEPIITSVQPKLSTITTESLNNHPRPTEASQLITTKENTNETLLTVNEKVNTLLPSEFLNTEITEEDNSASKLTTISDDHVESTTSTNLLEEATLADRLYTTKPPERILSSSKSPERKRTTTKSQERIRSTTRAYYSVEPLEQLFNLTEISNNETSTEALELVPIVDGLMKNETEITTRPYRLRPMKFGNNTRPRFSVKDYKSRLDHRNRLSQTTESSLTAVSVKAKGMGKYKYTPRNSYPKIKSATPSSVNRTNDFEPEVRKIKNPNRFNGGYRNRGSNQTADVNIEIKGNLNISTKAENKFSQPIRRRPHLKSSGQLAQMMKRNKNNMQLIRSTKMPISPVTQSSELKNESFATEEALELKITGNGDLKNEDKGEKINEEISESTTQEIAKDSLQNSSLQSDEEVFAKASQSVADLTSSASALYNKPGMFKALSSMPYYESEHKKSFKPTFDDTSLPIEAFFHGLTQSKE